MLLFFMGAVPFDLKDFTKAASVIDLTTTELSKRMIFRNNGIIYHIPHKALPISNRNTIFNAANLPDG